MCYSRWISDLYPLRPNISFVILCFVCRNWFAVRQFPELCTPSHKESKHNVHVRKLVVTNAQSGNPKIFLHPEYCELDGTLQHNPPVEVLKHKSAYDLGPF